MLKPSHHLPPIILLLLAGPAPAAVTVCEPPPDDSRISLAYTVHDDATLRPGGVSDRETLQEQIFLRLDDNWSAGFGHDYDVLNIDEPVLQTNGHVHVFHLPLHWRNDGAWLRFSLAPALAASSNIVTDPGEYGAEEFQLLSAIVARNPLATNVTLRYGLCGDYRFGQYRLYPTATIEWTPSAQWHAELGWPRSALRFEATGRIGAFLEAAPAGNQWRVRDRNSARASPLNYEATTIEAGIRWRPLPQLAVTLAAGRQLDAEYRVALVDGRRVRLDEAAATRLRGEIAWLF